MTRKRLNYKKSSGALAVTSHVAAQGLTMVSGSVLDIEQEGHRVCMSGQRHD